MEILSNGTIVISNRDLEPLQKDQRYAKLKPEVIGASRPKEQSGGAMLFGVLHVKKNTPSFQLPEGCVLLALEGEATVAATGRGCAIWYCENLSLEADVAVLGAGRVKQLNSDVVSLLPADELRNLLPGVSPHRLTIGNGHVEYLFLAHQDSEFLKDSPNRIGAEILGSGSIEGLSIGKIDCAITRQGNLSVEREIYLEEWLREARITMGKYSRKTQPENRGVTRPSESRRAL